MNLNDLSKNDNFIIQKLIISDLELKKRLIDMGFSSGVKGKIVRIAPLGDPIVIKILRYEISLRRSEAEGILVSKENT